MHWINIFVLFFVAEITRMSSIYAFILPTNIFILIIFFPYGNRLALNIMCFHVDVCHFDSQA